MRFESDELNVRIRKNRINLLKPEPHKSTLRILVEGIPFFIVTILALIGFVTVFTFVMDTVTSLNTNEKEIQDKTAIDFDKRFVIYNQNLAGNGNQIRLDLQTGCLYIENDGSLSVLLKNETTADCNISYANY